MPRTTDQQYIERYIYVRVVWQQFNRYFGYLTSRSQSYLHDYFQPDLNLKDSQLIAYRRLVSGTRPALPRQAGRAFAQLRRAIDTGTPESGARSTAMAGGRTIHISGIRHSRVDTNRLASALLGHLRTQRVSQDADREKRTTSSGKSSSGTS
jgi:hypothetical protein